MFAFRETRGPVEVAFTDRHGGVSGGPFASLNLAAAGADDAGRRCRQNLGRRRWQAFAGVGGRRPWR